MAEYQRREWLRKDNSSSVFASIDEDGYPELLISDGQSSVDLMALFGFDDPAQCQANLDAIRVLFDVLADFHSAYQNAIQDTVTR